MDTKKIMLMSAGVVAVIAVVFFTGYKFGAKSLSSQTAATLPSAAQKLPTPDELFNKQPSCGTTDQDVVVSGTSLSGVLGPGVKVTAAMNYYACNSAKVGDIVLYHWTGSPDPLIKIVKAVPGDKLALAPAGKVWNILVNRSILKNSKGESYVIGSPDRLNLYLRDYKGVLPKDAYIIMGNVATGSEDSTVFGFVDKGDFLGKVSP